MQQCIVYGLSVYFSKQMSHPMSQVLLFFLSTKTTKSTICRDLHYLTRRTTVTRSQDDRHVATEHPDGRHRRTEAADVAISKSHLVFLGASPNGFLSSAKRAAVRSVMVIHRCRLCWSSSWTLVLRLLYVLMVCRTISSICWVFERLQLGKLPVDSLSAEAAAGFDGTPFF